MLTVRNCGAADVERSMGCEHTHTHTHTNTMDTGCGQEQNHNPNPRTGTGTGTAYRHTRHARTRTLRQSGRCVSGQVEPSSVRACEHTTVYSVEGECHSPRGWMVKRALMGVGPRSELVVGVHGSWRRGPRAQKMHRRRGGTLSVPGSPTFFKRSSPDSDGIGVTCERRKTAM
jgi:hypothetical protein